MNTLRMLVAGLGILVSVAAGAGSMVVEVIPLKHRLTADVLPIIQPLVADGGTVTGMNNQVVVKTTPANLEEIRQVLESIDSAPRRLMITVRQNVDGNIHRDEQGVSGRYTSGDVTIASPDPGARRGGGVVAIRDDEGNVIGYRALSTRSSREDKSSFSVQATEGYPAFIHTGQSVPVANQQTIITPGGGVIVQDGIQYRDVTSGFYVLPRLSGDRVTLLVAPQLNRVNDAEGGVFDIQSVETTATGRLGEWIELGGVSEQFDDKGSLNLTTTRRRGQEFRNIAVKVTEIP